LNANAQLSRKKRDERKNNSDDKRLRSSVKFNVSVSD
jgi:hypothetical protein